MADRVTHHRYGTDLGRVVPASQRADMEDKTEHVITDNPTDRAERMAQVRGDLMEVLDLFDAGKVVSIAVVVDVKDGPVRMVVGSDTPMVLADQLIQAALRIAKAAGDA